MRLFVATLAIVLCGCDSDVTSHRYADMGAAKNDGLFDKGWLPGILPSSTTEITTNNDTSANSSTGSFRISPTQSAHFYELLEPGAPRAQYFKDWRGTVDRYKLKGYSAWTYQEGDYTWTFFCKPTNDHCDYYLWPTKHAV